MQAFLWSLVVIGSLIGMLLLALSFVLPNSAPQESAMAAMAVGCAVIPYCLARAFEKSRR